MNKEEIEEKLKRFPYCNNNYWLITGGAMVLYGLREETEDIDIGCTSELANELEIKGYLFQVMSDGNRWFKLSKDIEAFENWLYDTVVTIDGFPVISLQGLREMKQRLGREKDLRDIKLIDDYLTGTASER